MIFNQSQGAGGAASSRIQPSLTGNLSMVQNGTGITVLQPGAANTYYRIDDGERRDAPVGTGRGSFGLARRRDRDRGRRHL